MKSMVYDTREEMLNYRDFDEIFNKKFRNFLDKAPIRATYKMKQNQVDVEVFKDGEDSTFFISFVVNPKNKVEEEIYNIKLKLIDEFYPIFVVRKKVSKELTIEEKNKLALTGKTIDEVLSAKDVEIIEERYQIERMFNGTGMFHIRNLDTGDLGNYKIKNGYAFFKLVNRFQNFNIYDEEVSNMFIENARFDNKIYSKEEWEVIQEGNLNKASRY